MLDWKLRKGGGSFLNIISVCSGILSQYRCTFTMRVLWTLPIWLLDGVGGVSVVKLTNEFK